MGVVAFQHELEHFPADQQDRLAIFTGGDLGSRTSCKEMSLLAKDSSSKERDRALATSGRIAAAFAIGAMWIAAAEPDHLVGSVIIGTAFGVGAWLGLPVACRKFQQVPPVIHLSIVATLVVVILSLGLLLGAFERPVIQLVLGFTMLIGFAVYNTLFSRVEPAEADCNLAESTNAEQKRL